MDDPQKESTNVATLPDTALQEMSLEELARHLNSLQSLYAEHAKAVQSARDVVATAEGVLKQSAMAIERYKLHITKRIGAIRVMA